jgi:hypothetical protein
MALYFRDWRAMWEWWLSNDSLPGRLDAEPEDGCQLALDMLSGGVS